MIHILVGGDTKNKGNYIKDLTSNRENVFIGDTLASKDSVMSYCYGIDLFDKSSFVVLENVLNGGDINFSTEELVRIKESNTLFIFKEDKLSVALQNKYKKYGEIKIFEEKKVTQVPKFNVFNITDAFANKDKILAWTLYNKGIKEGIEGEAIAGILFWKIKTMLLNGSNVFSRDDLKQQSSKIISLYHKAHRGEIDLSLGLEQFILTSLTSK
jgi:hypothetical protein